MAEKPKKKGKRRHKRRPGRIQETAKKRIARLFELAGDIFSKDSSLADHYVGIARKTAMKVKVKMPSVYRRQFCKHCYSFLVPSANCRVRLHEGKVVYYCLKCKKFNRVGYKIKDK